MASKPSVDSSSDSSSYSDSPGSSSDSDKSSSNDSEEDEEEEPRKADEMNVEVGESVMNLNDEGSELDESEMH